MDIKEVMEQNVFAVVGNTISEEKYAYKIKEGLKGKGYVAYGVSKENKSLNEIKEEIDIIDMCINPPAGLKYLKENTRKCKCVVLQPGAESKEIMEYLDSIEQPYIEGCILVGLSLYSKK